ncbi:PREDICTED: uncharacterized protein LOC109191921 isoform X2 [Ipomoea nil]|uniref:uncharacterized protein LOC109191921 isoform X2 n=1 Tax=Ipomoea nil TaxID=35883 RepID=UPI000900A530|nr:PREDICTED: uncharacterized protein LOC109191921 isoform X2 [Ipomoea nil]
MPNSIQFRATNTRTSTFSLLLPASHPPPFFSHAESSFHCPPYPFPTSSLLSATLPHIPPPPSPILHPLRFSAFRRFSSTMPSGDFMIPPFELASEFDFDRVVSSDGLVSICGFGSLLSERSARSTFPDLINFRVAKLSGFRRVFAHAAPIFFERGIARPETKEISSLSVEHCEGETLVISKFEIPKSEIPAFIEREHEFRFLAVTPETLNGLFYTNHAVLCARYTDEEYFKNRCKGRVPFISKETERSTFRDMGNITSTRFGEMIFYPAVFIYAIVSWQQQILVRWHTIIF